MKVRKAIEEFRIEVSKYQEADIADNNDYLHRIQKLYTNLRTFVAQPFNFLVFAEQQYLKAIKQVYGNKIITKK